MTTETYRGVRQRRDVDLFHTCPDCGAEFLSAEALAVHPCEAGEDEHTLTLEPDTLYPHLARAHCSCGQWHSSGYVRPELAAVLHARHAITAPQ